MKRGKKLLFLLLALVVVSAAAAAATLLAPDQTAEEEDSTVVFSLDADAITALTWTYSGETVSLSHKDGTWGYEDQPAGGSQLQPPGTVEAVTPPWPLWAPPAH